jgi:hypothetical protein
VPDDKHGSETFYAGADFCGHVQPDEPESADADWTAWEAWVEDHPNSAGPNGEPICLDTPDGTFCPACTAEAQENEDLPEGEFVTCRLAEVPGA